MMKKSEAGQGLVEYALILVLVSITVIAILSLLGPQIGNVFSDIVHAYGTTSYHSTPDQANANRDEGDDLGEGISALGAAAIDQEEKLHDAFSQLDLGLNDSLTVLIVHAQASGDDTLAQSLTALQQELQAGNYDALPGALVELNTAFANAPFEVQVAVAEAISESSVDACKELAGATVSADLYQTAVAAINQREAEAPGSTGEALSILQETWNEIIEPRNQVAADGETGMETLLSLLIGGLEATGETELLKLAHQLSHKADGCGSMPNMAPMVQTGPDHTIAVDQAVNVVGLWKDPAGHLDEPYAWAWDLDGDGVWDSQGTSDYGPALVETVTFTQPGIYTLTLSVTDKDGASDVDSLTVTVEE